MALTCMWKGDNGCGMRATEIAVSGCLNQHVKDIPLCDTHAGQWIRTCETGMQCSICYQPIQHNWVMIQTYRAKPDYQLGLQTW